MNQNDDLKRARGNIPYSVIALKLKVSESTLYRWFRSQLPLKRKTEILNAIKDIKSELI